MKTVKYEEYFFWALVLTAFFSCSKKNDFDWEVYRGGPESNAYSGLSEINKVNVKNLKVAWTYQTGDNNENSADLQCNPLIVKGILYATSPKLKLFALNAATGKEIWKFDPFLSEAPAVHPNRGVVYWEDGDDKRILYTAGSYLYAIDAGSGKPVTEFGNNGRVSLHQGLDREVGKLYVVSTSPGIVYKNLLILGSKVSEGHDAAPGHIRAFDVKTGERKWIFHTIPKKGERGADTWPEEALETVGGANCWSGFSLDKKRGWVFVPTGSPSYDFYGANRQGDNLFGNCILALNAETGEYIWHFQTVHHDLWDRDLPCQPNLVTVKHNGKNIDAVAQVSKSGFVFLLDRETGKPLFPVVEKIFTGSDLPGEISSPTQPIPLKPSPFARQIFTEEEISGFSPDRDSLLNKLQQVRSLGQFTPSSRQGTMIFPGFDGGAEWGGAAVDPEKGILYVNSNEMPWILTMIGTGAPEGTIASAGLQAYTINCTPCHGADRMGDQHTFPSLLGLGKRLKNEQIHQIVENGKGRMPSFKHIPIEKRKAIISYLLEEKSLANKTYQKDKNENQPSPFVSTGYHRFLDKNGYPAVCPPWGTLNAIDLNTGDLKWKVTLGEFEELTKKGIPPTGTENYGGPIITKTGLLFIGATQDKKFRAFDTETGKIVWETELPAGGYATPATYSVNGKQYVVIAAGGVKMRSAAGDYYVAFGLE